MRFPLAVLFMLVVTANSWSEQSLLPAVVSAPTTGVADKSHNDGAKAGGVKVDVIITDKKQSIVFQSLAQLDSLIELGMSELALNLLEDEQKKRQQFTAGWYAFEYKRILLLSALERWQQLIDRSQWLFESAVPDRHITTKIRLWFETQQVIARLQLKQADLALYQLQDLLWHSTAQNRDPSLPRAWRRLVIRAYLQLQKDDDARKALVKYQQDYKTNENDIDWILLQAQVLLKTNRPELATQVLNQAALKDEVDINALLLLAGLQTDPKSAKRLYEQMRKQLDGQVLSSRTRWAKSYVAYTAAKLLADQPAQILNLESMLSLNIRYPVFDKSYQVSADDLWSLYSKQGLIIANNNGLLFGNDEQWQKLSDRIIKRSPARALQLNAALVLHTDNFLIKQQQHKTIVEILEKRKNGLELINKLYLHSDKISDVALLPDEVRYRLVDYALSEGDYIEAARLMQSLKEPPAGKTVFDWRMRKARVLILQGGYQQSEDILRETFAEKPEITRQEQDRYIQVVFDFQTVQQHRQAISLFDLLNIETLDDKLQREIYFWKAESYFSLGKFDYAAFYYLKSARAVVDGGNDLWAQSARFKAGKALLLAEIYEDAEKVYLDLLAITDGETRKALIEQNLQKIRLLKSSHKKSAQKQLSPPLVATHPGT